MAWGTEGEIRPRWLRCSVQNYDWGRRGKDSTVAKLFSANSESEAEFDKSYAEFWMGTHESGPSFLVPEVEGKGGEMVRLKDWIRENPNVIGMKVVDKWGCDLPFLFKVLSVSKALSIQAHPDKELAMMLHKLKPTVYKDDNHKPEMAVAITKFKALCGFISLQLKPETTSELVAYLHKTIYVILSSVIKNIDQQKKTHKCLFAIFANSQSELKTVLKSVPEIAEFVGRKETSMILEINDQIHVGKVKDMLQSLFTRLMTADENTISKLIYKLKGRLSSADKIGMLTEKERLALKLEKQYPGDVGVVSSFFFNYVKLKPGEALYLGPNEPHAYLSGECIECMATSDNVVRAGLTPKFRDVHTLCSMLTYKQGFPEILKGIPLNRYISRYTPPFDEFEVDSCFLPSKESVVFPAALGPSLFVILNGDGDARFDSSKEKDAILEGDVLFVPEKTQITITAGAIGDLQLYRAGVNQRFFE